MSCGIDKDTVSSFAKRNSRQRDNDEVVFELNLFLKKVDLMFHLVQQNKVYIVIIKDSRWIEIIPRKVRTNDFYIISYYTNTKKSW